EDAFAECFAGARPLEEMAEGWSYWEGFITALTLDEVLDQPGRLTPAVRAAFAKSRRRPGRPVTEYQVHRAGQACAGRAGLLPDALFAPVMKLSQGKKVFYHQVAGNVGDDLIHAGATQLFARFGIQITTDPSA